MQRFEKAQGRPSHLSTSAWDFKLLQERAKAIGRIWRLLSMWGIPLTKYFVVEHYILTGIRIGLELARSYIIKFLA